MKNFIVYGLVAFVTGAIWASASFAAATSTSFKCSTTTKYCSCDINVAGDCDAMKKNCKGGTIGSCSEINGKQICLCEMAIRNRNSGQTGKKKLPAVSE